MCVPTKLIISKLKANQRVIKSRIAKDRLRKMDNWEDAQNKIVIIIRMLKQLNMSLHTHLLSALQSESE